jgi:amino acid adenylation domain-containing protein
MALRHSPEKTAFKVDDQDGISYSEFYHKASLIANRLRSSDKSKTRRIGLLLPRSILSPISVYGILMAGHSFVPIDPTLPIERIVWMIENCGIEILVSDPLYAYKFRGFKKFDLGFEQIIGIGSNESYPGISWEELWSMDIKEYFEVEANTQDLAYIMYTSGTTGSPKGIMHTHFSCLNYASNSMELFEVVESDLLVIHPPLHFDISTMGYFTMPLAGATSLILSNDIINFPGTIVQVLKNQAVTIWYSVPKAIYQLMDTGEFTPENFPSLRHILYGGEPFERNRMRKLLDTFPNATVTNVYGPAEVNQCSYYFIPRDYNPKSEIPLGQIWKNTTYKILNDQGDKSRFGELLISSPTMMKGYWNNEHLTQKSIVEFEENCQLARYYRTGDLVSFNQKDQLLYFHGRSDRQVKLNGYRIELNEVQFAINEIDGIDESAVCLVDDQENKKMIAFYKAMNKVERRYMQESLRSKLPKYAMPSEFVHLEELPRTNAGKINYKTLSANFMNKVKNDNNERGD